MADNIDRATVWWYKGSAKYQSGIFLAPPAKVMLNFMPRLEPDALEVIGLYVHPARRGYGWGHALMQRACEHADSLGVPLALYACPFGRAAAPLGPLVRLYRAHGFERRTPSATSRFNLPEGSVLMKRLPWAK